MGTPTWLHNPPDSAVPPPGVPRGQTLPFQDLSWRNFQRLIVRLVATGADVEDAREYGVPGQAQSGIDLYARRRGSARYTTFQCKRAADFTPGDLRAAVDEFLVGSWAERSEQFVVCTSAEVERTEIAEELERQVERTRHLFQLALHGSAQLTQALKQHPEIVLDFFDTPWVVLVCGQREAAKLQSRLRPDEVTKYRGKLRSLYTTIFTQHDPGIPIEPTPGVPVPALADRFVHLDVNEARELATEAPRVDSHESNEKPDQSGPASGKRRFEARLDMDSWLAASDQSLLIGGPGTGKSTLLRFVALDLLSDKPTLSHVSARWGGRLPLWLPFGYWTRLVSAAAAGVPLSQCLRQWLSEHGHDDLWPLVERAIDDSRLLLLVDGLDEWTTEDAARIAHDLLVLFIETKHPAVLVSTRPYGHARLLFGGESWQTGEIASLSKKQQSEIVGRWFQLRTSISAASNQKGSEDEALAAAEADRFMGELTRSPELSELASAPLTLVLLIFLRFQQSVLPRSRFRAYEALISQLVRVHPAARRSAALLAAPEPGLPDEEVEEVLARLAYAIQERWPEGVVREDDLRQLIPGFLAQIGVPSEEVRRHGAKFIDLVEGRLGIMVHEGDQLFFLHRALQEFLASQYLASLPLTSQSQVLLSHIEDPRWDEVLRATLWRIRRPDELEKLLEATEQADSFRSYRARELRAEVAFGDFQCPPVRAIEIALQSFEVIETGAWLPHRERMLRLVLAGLRPSRTRELVRDRLARWAISPGLYRASDYEPLRRWPATSETVQALWSATHDEDPSVGLAGAIALAGCAHGDSDIGNRLLEATRVSSMPTQRAAALIGVVEGWPGLPGLAPAIEQSRKSESTDLRVAAIRARIVRKEHDDADLNELLRLSHELRYGPPWSREVPRLLVLGWQGSSQLRAAALAGANNQYNVGEGMDRDIATHVLLTAFPHDDAVADFIVEELKKEHPFLLSIDDDPYAWIAESFRGDSAVIEALEDWAERNRFVERELAHAVRIGPTERFKSRLIGLLDEGSFPHWAASALLSNWGMRDPDVSDALDKIVGTPRQELIAYELPQVIQAPDQARAVLVEMLASPACRRPDFVLEGLGDLPHNAAQLDQIVDLGLAAVDRNPGFGSGSWVLIQKFSKHPAVRRFAIEQLDADDPPISPIAWAYYDDAEIRTRVCDLLVPLPRQLREIIIRDLGETASDPETADSILRRYRQEGQPELLLLGSIGYHKRIRGDPGAVEAATRRLAKEIAAYGPRHNEERAAALAGLVTLDRLDLFQAGMETIGEKRPSRIELTHWRPNVALLHLLARNWPSLRDHLGDNIYRRFDAGGNSFSVLSALAPVGDAYQEIRDEILERLVSGELAVDARTLRFLGAARPGSELLLRHLIDFLASGGASTLGRLRDFMMLAELLARQFGGRTEVAERLMTRTSSGAVGLHDDGILLALAAGWPNDPVLTRVFEELTQAAQPRVSLATGYAVLYARLPLSRLGDRFPHDLDAARFADPWVAEALRWGVLRRLTHDREAVDSLRSVLAGRSNSPSFKSSVPRLLRQVGRLDPETAAWCHEELNRQSQLEWPELGLDLISGEVRGVAVTLLDALSSSD